MDLDVSLRVGGQAGQGMQSIGYITGKVFTRHGYHVFINQDVESRIRGGHSFVQVRIRNEPVQAVSGNVDLLIALDKGSIDYDSPDLAEDGVMIFDGEKTGFEQEDPRHFSVPLERLATEAGKNRIMVNAVAAGAAFALMDFDLAPLLDRVEEEFGRKSETIVQNNKNSAAAGYAYVRENYKGAHPHKIPPAPFTQQKLLMNGSEAMATGALCSGLKFYSGYPMSPATPIMEFVASMAQEHNVILEPAEDEIAAINMVIGASFAGVRAMTATSGGGFCLMVEALGLAGMTETPVVVIVAQRPGPSTGLPTRTEQGDLKFVVHASHGEFPRAVFAPGNPEQAFYLMGKAFNMADHYQTPVVVLGEQHLNDSYFTMDPLDLSRIAVDRGSLVFEKGIPFAKDYKRYAWNDSGISPRILPGQSRAVLYADSDEHSEAGHIVEAGQIRKQMMEKRMRKLEGMRREMGPPEIYPSEKSEHVLLGWGSTYGALKEAVDLLNRDGVKAQMVHFSEIFPFPSLDFLEQIQKDPKVFAVEGNFTGQFADLFSFETGIPVFRKVLKYDGRPFCPHEIVSQTKNRL